jgi:hypothetical protein
MRFFLITFFLIPFLQIMGCRSNLPPSAALRIRVESELQDISEQLVMPEAINMSNGQSVVLSLGAIVNDSIYWWTYLNMGELVGETIIFSMKIDGFAFEKIIVDTVVIKNHDEISYGLFLGKSPQFGIDQSIYRKVPLIGRAGDTLYIDRTILDERPVL